MAAISFVQAFSFSAYSKYFQKGLNSRSASDRGRCYIAIELYRELQILNRYYNNLQQDVFIYVALFISLTAVIPSAYIVIAFGPMLKVPEFFLFSFAIFNGLVVILLFFTVMANVNSEAVEGIQVVRSKFLPLVLGKRERKWVEAYWHSLRPLKVYIGSTNFVDKATPFMLLKVFFDSNCQFVID